VVGSSTVSGFDGQSWHLGLAVERAEDYVFRQLWAGRRWWRAI
jgi:hypothetical protein